MFINDISHIIAWRSTLLSTKCIWCKEKKEDEEFDNPALGVCKECNNGANERHKQYLEWKKDHPRRRRRRYWY